MNLSRRAETFEQLRAKYVKFLASVLWKLTGDRELFTEAMQNALLGIWQNIEKLNGKKAASYIYRIALTAAPKPNFSEKTKKSNNFLDFFLLIMAV